MLSHGVDPQNAFYVLNPHSNLSSTEERFRASFSRSGMRVGKGRGRAEATCVRFCSSFLSAGSALFATWCLPWADSRLSLAVKLAGKE